MDGLNPQHALHRQRSRQRAAHGSGFEESAHADLCSGRTCVLG